MLALTFNGATDLALLKIAKAFCRQKYPLTNYGEAVKSDVMRALELGDIDWLRGNAGILPTVEYPQMEYFKEVDPSPLSIEELLGHKLTMIQTHRGCTHQCYGFCHISSPCRIVAKMPFAALLMTVAAKNRCDRKNRKIALNWFRNLRKLNIARYNIFDQKEAELESKMHQMNQRDFQIALHDLIRNGGMTFGRFCRFVMGVDALADLHPIGDRFRRYPMEEGLSFKKGLQLIAGEYWNYIPVWHLSTSPSIANYDDSDPLQYCGTDFRHLDGTPADYGDVFVYMASQSRPVFVSTAGWLLTDTYAEKAIDKILYVAEHWPNDLNSLRISVQQYERLARSDPEKYLCNVERMLGRLMPLVSQHLGISIIYDPRKDGDNKWAHSVRRRLGAVIRREYGSIPSDLFHYGVVSRKTGRAYDPEYAEIDSDVAGQGWGYMIRPDGRVDWQDEPVWKRYPDPTGRRKTFRHLESLDSSRKSTGVKLW